ncbi:MAG TPA: zf-TFIIB domain-containing protein [Kofleriaceae bacterium]|jgi:Zn-finger nucleic acid-binding protein|nr:zf-TFIIB domain-containing protein [Kofleriaceae bacterium]
MTYRDRVLACPRCGVPLERPARRDSWSCSGCNGVAIELAELLRILLRFSSDLVDRSSNDIDAPTIEDAVPGLPCPVCVQPMRQVSLHGVRGDRCDRDQLIWFDSSELEQVIEGAIDSHDARKSLVQKLRELFFAS